MTQVVEHHTDTSDMLIPHGVFRTGLGTAGRIIDAVQPGDTEQLAVVSGYLDNLLYFLDAHHGGEDAVVWPVLAARCDDAAALLARMAAEHDAIHELRIKSGALIEAWSRSGDPADGRAVTESLRSLLAEIEVHFGEEEAEILPLASKNMSPEEWGAMPGHAMRQISGDQVWLVLGLVFEQMTPEQLETVVPHMPPPVIDMWNTTGRAKFDTLIATVRGTS